MVFLIVLDVCPSAIREYDYVHQSLLVPPLAAERSPDVLCFRRVTIRNQQKQIISVDGEL